jgi:hypothetical protein
MGGFLNALSFLAPIAPAQAEAREIRRVRGIEDQEAKQRAALGQQEIARSQQDIQLRSLEAQQKLRKERQPVVFGNPEWDSTKGQYTVLALDPDKGIIRMPVPGGESPEAEAQRKAASSLATFEKVTGRKATPEESTELAYAALGIKQPSFRAPQGYTDPSTGLRYSVYTDAAGQHVIPVMGPDGKQLGGLKPPEDSTTTGFELKQNENGEWVKVPVSHTTRKSYDAVGAASPVSRTVAPSTAGGLPSAPGMPKGAVDTGVHGKYSSQDAGILQSTQEIQSAANDILPILAKYKDRNGIMDRIAAEKAWLTYKSGFTPSDPLYSQIIKPVALLFGIGSSQWTRVGRGKYLFERLSQHLPQPTDTPALLYDKINWLANNVANETRKAVMNPVGPSAAPGGTDIDAIVNALKGAVPPK